MAEEQVPTVRRTLDRTTCLVSFQRHRSDTEEKLKVVSERMAVPTDPLVIGRRVVVDVTDTAGEFKKWGNMP